MVSQRVSRRSSQRSSQRASWKPALCTVLVMGTQWLLPSPFLRSDTRARFDGAVDSSVGGAIDVAINWRSALGVIQPSTAADLDEIRDRGYLIVAVKNNQAPLGFVDTTGELRGFEIDIAHRLAEDLLGDASAVRFVPVRNVDRLNAVLADRVDIAIAAITLTEPRRRLVNFSDPYYFDGAGFITTNPQIQQLSDLRRATIAVLDRSSTVARVRYTVPGAQLRPVVSYDEARSLLAEGAVDAFAGDASVLAGWLPTADAYRLLPQILSVEPLAVALPKGTQYDALRSGVNQSIRQGYAEGWLQERAIHWGLPAEDAAEAVTEFRL
jgi:polar amino acid transport system substrate-binding protein